jgi:hypothetical protein
LKPETLAIHSYAAGLLQAGSVSSLVAATICYPQADEEDVDMNEHFIKMYSGGCTVLRSWGQTMSTEVTSDTGQWHWMSYGWRGASVLRSVGEYMKYYWNKEGAVYMISFKISDPATEELISFNDDTSG